MNLYDQLFPEDSNWSGEEKVASRSMDYFGIRFDERVEKLAGVADVAKRVGKGIQEFAESGLRDIQGKGTFNVRGGKPSYIGRSGNEGKVQALPAFSKKVKVKGKDGKETVLGGFSGRGLAEQALSRTRGAGKLGLLGAAAASPLAASYYAGTKAGTKKRKR